MKVWQIRGRMTEVVREYMRVLIFPFHAYPGGTTIPFSIFLCFPPRENPFKDARHMSGLAKEGERAP
jgi:hypothetical protein